MGADVRVGSLLAEDARQVDDGDVGRRHAERHAGQLAVQVRQHLADGLGGAGRGRDDVLARAAAAAPVLARGAVDRLLRGGRRVHGRHQALDDPVLLVDDLGEWREAVGRAGGVGQNVDVLRVLGLVDAHDKHRRVRRRRRDDHLLGAALDVLHAVGRRREGASGLADVLDAGVLPRDLRGVARRGERDGQAVDGEATLHDLAGAREAAVDRVVLEQVLHVLGRHGRVDVLEHERLAVHGDAHDLAADAAEAVDAQLDRGVGVGRHADRAGERERGGSEREGHVGIWRFS
mmetsp:Transcript_23254/g.68964  ORF Transcript_23254/g.68964 Transcript_23254/m.68964 type:complete len:290 (+) Transcript_23254:1003-1872(+)